MLADQFLGGAAINIESQKGLGPKMPKSSSLDPLGFYSLQAAEVAEVHGPEEVPCSLHHQGADCSTESCLTSHESPEGLTLDGSSAGGRKRMLNLEPTAASLIWDEAKMRTSEVNVAQVNPHDIAGYGIWS